MNKDIIKRKINDTSKKKDNKKSKESNLKIRDKCSLGETIKIEEKHKYNSQNTFKRITEIKLLNSQHKIKRLRKNQKEPTKMKSNLKL